MYACIPAYTLHTLMPLANSWPHNVPRLRLCFHSLPFDDIHLHLLIHSIYLALPCAVPWQHEMDLRQEDPEDMVVRMLSLLRVLRYKPPVAAGFRQGLVSGATDVVGTQGSCRDFAL